MITEMTFKKPHRQKYIGHDDLQESHFNYTLKKSKKLTQIKV